MAGQRRATAHSIRGETVIDAEPGAVWDVLSDFYAVETWAPPVTRCHAIGDVKRGVGAARHLDVKWLGGLDEVVTRWEDHRSLSYRVTPIGPIGESTSHWDLEPGPEGGTRVALRLDYDMRLGFLGEFLHALVVRRELARNLPGALKALKRRVETGRTVRPRRSETSSIGSAALSILLLGAIAAPGMAQLEPDPESPGNRSSAVEESAERSGGIEEIVVRARRRDEFLEDTPVSVTALDQDALRNSQVTRLDEVAALVPNINILAGRSGQDASIFVRGVGAFPLIFFDQGVGTYVDGVFLSRQQGSLLDIVDIEQIEVLRGPQGTLFGKNTVGGAINITTVKPKDEFEGFVSLRAGSYGRVEPRATLNIPIEYGWLDDKLFTRFTVATANHSGYTENTLTGERYSDTNAISFYGSALLRPVDDVTLTVTGTWTRDHNRGRGGQCRFVGPPPALFAGFLPPDFEAKCNASRRFKFESDVPAVSDNESYGVWGVLDWAIDDVSLFDDLNVKATGAWRQQRTRTRDDNDMTSENVFTIAAIGGAPLTGGPNDARQFQQEVQVNGRLSDIDLFGAGLGMGGILESWDVTFVGGVFSFWETGSTDTTLLVLPETPLGRAGGVTDNLLDIDNWNWALFTQATADLTEWLSVTGGVRYTQEKKGISRFVGAADPDTGDLLATLADFNESKKFDAWTPMASIALKAPDAWIDASGFLDHVMAYFTYARGFRGGGFNGTARGDTPEDRAPFDPELIDSFEVGLKTVAFDRRLTLNAALFLADRRDQQVPQIVSGGCPDEEPGCIPALPNVQTRNAAESRSRGFEIELLAEPLDRLRINGSVGFLDSEFLDFAKAQDAVTGGEINRRGESFPFVPEWQTSMGLQYAYELPDTGVTRLDGSLTPRIDWSYESRVFSFGPEIEQLHQPGYHLLNFRLAYDLNDDRTQIAFWAKNLTDSEYFKNSVSWSQVIGSVVRYYEEPRTFGVELSHYF